MKKLKKAVGGFILVEALVATTIVSLGIAGLANLEARLQQAGFENRGRAIATSIARNQMETWRNLVEDGGYNRIANIVDAKYDKHAEANANGPFTMNATVTEPKGSDEKSVVIRVSWTAPDSSTREVLLESRIQKKDGRANLLLGRDTTNSVIAPTGVAKRGEGKYRPGDTAPTVSTSKDNITSLKDSSGKDILSLPSVGGEPQQFHRIYGRVYFEVNSSGDPISTSDSYFTRLSSEGECIYDHDPAKLKSAMINGNIAYKYYEYVCYVGPKWYGNVGITFEGTSKNNGMICVGDPTPNAALSGKTVTTEPSLGTTRSYRSYKVLSTTGSTTKYNSVGMGNATSDRTGMNVIAVGTEDLTDTLNMPVGSVAKNSIGYVYGDSGTSETKSGYWRPSENSSYAAVVQNYLRLAKNDTSLTVAAGSINDYYRNDFLVADSKGTCSEKMQMNGSNGMFFAGNAGGKVCISPDGDQGSGDACPDIWPGYAATSSGGTGNTGAICNFQLSLSMVSPAPVSTIATTNGVSTTCVQDNNTLIYRCGIPDFNDSKDVVIADISKESTWGIDTTFSGSVCAYSVTDATNKMLAEYTNTATETYSVGTPGTAVCATTKVNGKNVQSYTYPIKKNKIVSEKTTTCSTTLAGGTYTCPTKKDLAVDVTISTQSSRTCNTNTVTF